MSHSDTDPTKRIPKSLGTDPKLVGDYTLTDLVVAVAPAAVVVLATRTLLPSLTVAGYSVQALTLPLALAAMAVGALFVSLTPAYASSLTWLESFLSFHHSAPDVNHTQAASHTRIERVHPDHAAIERPDGTLVGAVQVEPAAMALATTEQWRQTAHAFTDVLNTTIEFPVQLYSTTRSFPVDEYLETYEARLDDPDVQANETLQQLIESYTEWYREDFERRETTIRDHYVIVPVRPESVRHTEASVTQRLAAIPVLGVVVDAVTAAPVAAERAAMASELDDRVRSLERGLRELDGCMATRIPAPELTDLVTDYWATHDAARDTAAALRTTPLVEGPN